MSRVIVLMLVLLKFEGGRNCGRLEIFRPRANLMRNGQPKLIFANIKRICSSPFASSAQQILFMHLGQFDHEHGWYSSGTLFYRRFCILSPLSGAFQPESNTLINHSAEMASKLSPSSEGLSAFSRLVRKSNGD
jgi:hypothetical protein